MKLTLAILVAVTSLSALAGPVICKSKLKNGNEIVIELTPTKNPMEFSEISVADDKHPKTFFQQTVRATNVNIGLEERPFYADEIEVKKGKSSLQIDFFGEEENEIQKAKVTAKVVQLNLNIVSKTFNCQGF